ncbi:urea amidolyase family protein [Kocuria sp. HMSC066H03]|uniref:5-oxoprolinase subunit B/C family protein n=1 Tax=Kocuria sp. HMSC066H03 TaxID=1739337 RepID=UPI0008A572D0|nr:urea amidolyase family protein [Kocuria sp. HMSC066H03]OFK05815.1 urea amidolyase [Kocuria sp. HMSC066H03]
MSAPRPRQTPRAAQGPGAQQTGRPGTTGTVPSSSAEVRPAPELRWAGTHAFLLDCGELADVVRWHAHLTAHPFAGQTDVIAAARTVLVTFTDARSARKAASGVATAQPREKREAGGKTVEIPVVYDGADLAEVARLTGLSEQGVVNTHTGAEWTAAFGGFAPGFAYLSAPGNPLDVPRRDTPRTAVPAGSVALAGVFSAIYPQRSPGGWQLIGRTDAVLWDTHRDSPALIRPGDTVRFRAVRDLVTVTDDTAPELRGDPQLPGDSAPAIQSGDGPGQNTAGPGCDTSGREHADGLEPISAADGSLADHGGHALVVEDPGMQTLVQDLGRPALGDLGVVASGAADRASAMQANRIVGNASSDAVLEVTMGGLRLTARGHHVLALTGAPVGARITGGETERAAPFCTPFALYDGEQLALDTPSAGLRSYLAVSGGLDTTPVLGSRATDVMSGIGPAPLAAGDMLPVLPAAPGRAVGHPEEPAVHVPTAAETTVLRVLPGPREDWFSPEALSALRERTWRVSSDSNRVGVRFETPPEGGLARSRKDELASEGVVAGSLQVPHSGVPVLFLADHPVTGGYPVIAVVLPQDLPLAAQLLPGSAVRFHPVPHPPGDAALASPQGGAQSHGMMQRTRPTSTPPAGIRGIRERATRPPEGAPPHGAAPAPSTASASHTTERGMPQPATAPIPTATVPAEQPTSGDTA